MASSSQLSVAQTDSVSENEQKFYNSCRCALRRFEGRVNHLYLDCSGNVTAGTGHMVCMHDAKIPESALALPFYIRGLARPASRDEIANEIKSIQAQKFGKKIGSEYYRQFTALELKDAGMDVLETQDINGKLSILRRDFPDYDSYPLPARLAMMDIQLNITHRLPEEKGFPMLTIDIRNRNWLAASASDKCHRREDQVGKERNDWTRDMFLEAAKIEQELKLDREISVPQQQAAAASVVAPRGRGAGGRGRSRARGGPSGRGRGLAISSSEHAKEGKEAKEAKEEKKSLTEEAKFFAAAGAKSDLFRSDVSVLRPQLDLIELTSRYIRGSSSTPDAFSREYFSSGQAYRDYLQYRPQSSWQPVINAVNYLASHITISFYQPRPKPPTPAQRDDLERRGRLEAFEKIYAEAKDSITRGTVPSLDRFEGIYQTCLADIGEGDALCSFDSSQLSAAARRANPRLAANMDYYSHFFNATVISYSGMCNVIIGYNNRLLALIKSNLTALRFSNIEDYYHIGVSYYNERDYNNAIFCLERCHSGVRDEIRLSALRILAMSYLQKSSPDYAYSERCLLEALQGKANDFGVYFCLGYVSLCLNKVADAVRYLETACGIDRTKQEALRMLGDIYLTQGDVRKAINRYSAYLVLNPRDREIDALVQQLQKLSPEAKATDVSASSIQAASSQSAAAVSSARFFAVPAVAKSSAKSESAENDLTSSFNSFKKRAHDLLASIRNDVSICKKRAYDCQRSKMGEKETLRSTSSAALGNVASITTAINAPIVESTSENYQHYFDTVLSLIDTLANNIKIYKKNADECRRSKVGELGDMRSYSAKASASIAAFRVFVQEESSKQIYGLSSCVSSPRP